MTLPQKSGRCRGNPATAVSFNINMVYYLPVRTALRKLTIFWRLDSSYMPMP